MELISGFGGTILSYIIPFLFVLTIVVFFHELGHFLVARWCGVAVRTFSIGFGPELFGWEDRQGTRWRVAAVPLGGYVRFAGDENAASVPDHAEIARMSPEEREGSFFLKPVWQRAAIVAAGPFANFILAIAIFTVLFVTFGRPITQARVDEVQPESPAAVAGFEPGDVIVAIDGQTVEAFSDVQRAVSGSGESALTFTVERGGERIDLTATPEFREVADGFGGTHRIGVLGIRRASDASQVETKTYSLPAAFTAGVGETWFIVDRTVSYISGVVTGRESPDQLGGPIRVAQVSGQVASIGIVALINLAAILSVSIGLINLLPIPMLDGGHLVFYGIEAARGRPLSERSQDIGFRIGLALVLMLMVFATFNDIRQIAGS
ncbi:RIP metalloprotease RseP [Amorphus orientalis]|uniref:Zinc metalloprotease n=1 Tax=Amorphus orientalis TaxID=649198 RepID=A0AAE3VN19_9HYPH|nr:RIP metalloprotease RseP [Amorphus orientalis]MDQ0315549.1 regulator of sigma E protease [Amorphus orientalis]